MVEFGCYKNSAPLVLLENPCFIRVNLWLELLVLACARPPGIAPPPRLSGLARSDKIAVGFAVEVAPGGGMCQFTATFITKLFMAQAIMDPEKVRRFADELQRFNADLENRMTLLHARFAALGDTWSDQEHEKFSEEFRQALKALKKFTEISKTHAPYLMRKAQRIEEYLNQR